MDICKDFSQLPTELRLLIWKQALRNESSSRLVLLHRTSRRVLPFRYLASPLLSVNMEARSVALKFYDVQLKVRPALPASPDTLRSMRKVYLDYWRKHPLYVSMEYWEDFGRQTEKIIDKSLNQNTQIGKTRGAHEGGAVYLSSHGDRLVESCDIWIDMGTICPGGRPTYDYRRLDICKAHIMQDSSPDFTGSSLARYRPEFHPPRTCLSDPIARDVLGRLRIVELTRPSLGGKLRPGLPNFTRGASVPYEPCENGLAGFVQAYVSHVEGVAEFFRELVLKGRGDYTILTWATN